MELADTQLPLLLLLLLVLILPACHCYGCTGAHATVSIGGVDHCFTLDTVAQTLEDAEEKCGEKVGGHLAAVDREDIQQALMGLLANQSVSEAWIGGRMEDDDKVIPQYTDSVPMKLWRWEHKCTSCATDIDETMLAMEFAQGCYGEWTGNPDFHHDPGMTAEQENMMTPEMCAEACGNATFLFAGLQKYKECRCGNYFGSYGEESPCNNQCTGDETKWCGGSGRISVYSSTIPEQYSMWKEKEPKVADSWEHCGTLDRVSKAGGDVYEFVNYKCYESRTFICELPLSDRCCLNASTTAQGSDETTALPCDGSQGGGVYRSVHGECLYFSQPGQEENTWYNAKQYCASRGGNLLFDKSAGYHASLNEEMMELYGDSALGESTWVGLTKFIWYWPPGFDLTYFRFGPGQPDVHQRCMYMANDNLWYSDDCDSSNNRAFICQQDTSITTPGVAVPSMSPFATDTAVSPTDVSEEDSLSKTTPITDNMNSVSLTSDNPASGSDYSTPVSPLSDGSSPINSATDGSTVHPNPSQTNSAENTDDRTVNLKTTQSGPTLELGTGDPEAATGDSGGLSAGAIALIVVCSFLVVLLIVLVLVYCCIKKKNKKVTPSGNYDARDSAMKPDSDSLCKDQFGSGGLSETASTNGLLADPRVFSTPVQPISSKDAPI